MSMGGRPTRWYVVAAFLLPSLAGFVVFVLLPMLATLGLAFTNYTGGLTISYVGLRNFLRVVTSPDFRNSLWITVKFLLITVPLQLALGLIFAVVLNQELRGRTFYRSVLFMPTVLSLVAVSLAFIVIFHPSGPLNGVLRAMGISPIPWLTSPKVALYSIILVTIWQTFGYYMVLFLSGLQAINPALYEAAEIDGATGLQKLMHITIPLLSPTTFFALIIAIINAFKVFDQVFVMTGGQGGGGPAGSTSVLVFTIYKDGFVFYDMGYASAEAVVLLLIILSLTVILYRGQWKWVHYEA